VGELVNGEWGWGEGQGEEQKNGPHNSTQPSATQNLNLALHSAHSVEK